MSNVSVIIRCRNEDHWIGHAIQSVLDTIENPEILIVNNNSTDNSLDIVRSFNLPNLKILEITDYTPGRALNLAAKAASHNLLLVLSAHCVLKKIDQSGLINLFKNYKAVFGKQIPVWNGQRIKPEFLWENFHNNIEENHFAKNENGYFLHNALCAYDRKFLLEHPFDEIVAGKEDRYWAKAIVAKGHKYLYHPGLLECHHHWTPNGATWHDKG